MRKYFTWRCIGLHALVLVIVPGFLFLGHWQYDAAIHGNELSWAYTVEWPLFAIYAVYMWWQLIHDKTTPLDRLRAAKERSAAAAAGTPPQEIAGWALDKKLSRTVTEASLGTGRTGALPSGERRGALASPEHGTGRRPMADAELAGEGSAGPGTTLDDTGRVVDADVVNVSVNEDEELRAYNRYLAELARSDPPKRW
jgi:hypothetical protein